LAPPLKIRIVNGREYRGVRAYAEHAGVRHRAIQSLVKMGKLPTQQIDGDVWIDVAAADVAYSSNVDPTMRRRETQREKSTKSTWRKPPAADRPKADVEESEKPAPAQDTIVSVTLKREKLKCEKLELDLERQRALTVSAKVAEGVLVGLASDVRTAMWNVPARIAPLLVGKSEEHEINQILEREIRHVLETLSDSACAKALESIVSESIREVT